LLILFHKVLANLLMQISCKTREKDILILIFKVFEKIARERKRKREE